MPGYEVLTWYAAFAPAATPKPILKRLYDETAAVLKSAELQEVYRTHGLEPGGESPQAMEKYLQGEISKWRTLIKASNIKAE